MEAPKFQMLYWVNAFAKTKKHCYGNVSRFPKDEKQICFCNICRPKKFAPENQEFSQH